MASAISRVRRGNFPHYDPNKSGVAGYWDYPNGSDTAPADGVSGIGFRVASLSSAAVPEPGSFAVLPLLGITGAAYRKRKRK